jgi:UDP-N-acetylmuramate: L-alanyl-gamma-D-glutamyl-meso-diaminopimelate ligase
MKLYFMGIGGTAMGQAARLARAAGHEVAGADTGVYPPMSTVLANAGIHVHEGYDPGRLAALAPDLVVIGNAMSRGNPEVEWLLDTRAIPFTSLPAMLHDLVLRTRRNLVICGTHGKTTTTALAAYLLRANGGDPGFLIGGVPQDPPEGSHLGAASDPFVIEGDEYDSAFFDKRSKFIHYSPHIAVFNNLEFDHADIFRDVADIQRTFLHLARIVPSRGWIVLNGDDERLRALGPMPWTQVIRVGTGPGNDVRIEGFAEGPAGAEFGLTWSGGRWAEVRWSLPGLYNARNAAMAATAVRLAWVGADPAVGSPGPASVRAGSASPASARAGGPALSLEPLARFRGVKRRQEVLTAGPAVTVIEDFGHHPTALAEALASFRGRYPGRVLTAVFEPRSNTARTRTLQAAFIDALAGADEVYLGAVNRADHLAAEDRFDAPAAAAQLQVRGVRAQAFSANAALLDALSSATLSVGAGGSPRVVIFFTNGSFDGIIARYASAARA